MRSLLSIIALQIALIFLAAGCSETCNGNHNALPLAGFYAIDSTGSLQSVSVDSLEVIGLDHGPDSILSPATAVKSDLYMPFRIDYDRTQYAFILRSEGMRYCDTVTFNYTRVLRFASAECGVSYVFHIHDITTTGVLFDSVVCPHGFIDNANIENLRIYLRTE